LLDWPCLAFSFYPFFSAGEIGSPQVKSSQEAISCCQGRLAELVYYLFVQAPAQAEAERERTLQPGMETGGEAVAA